jgi:hypothetical protein
MHNPKMKAEVMLPKLCSEAKSSDEIKTAKSVGTANFNLFKNTPLKINSSEIGETITVAIRPAPAREYEKLRDGTISKI